MKIKDGFRMERCYYCHKNMTEVSSRCIRYKCYECVNKELSKASKQQEDTEE